MRADESDFLGSEIGRESVEGRVSEHVNSGRISGNRIAEAQHFSIGVNPLQMKRIRAGIIVSAVRRDRSMKASLTGHAKCVRGQVREVAMGKGKVVDRLLDEHAQLLTSRHDFIQQ